MDKRARQAERVCERADVDQPIRAAGVLRVDIETDARGAVMRRAAGRGDLRRVRRGVYVGADHWEGIDPRQRHLIEIRAAIDAMRSPAEVLVDVLNKLIPVRRDWLASLPSQPF